MLHDTYLSKKFLFSIGAVVVTFAFCVLGATVVPGLKEYFNGFTGCLEFIVGAYVGGNLGNKLIATKTTTPAAKAPEGSQKAE
jgi:hypothetical protein